MGNSLHNLLFNKNKGRSVPIKPMKEFENANLKLRLVKEPKDTYIFDEASSEDVDSMMHECSFFNR